MTKLKYSCVHDSSGLLTWLLLLLLLPPLQEVLDWFEQRSLKAYSISAGQSLLYNDIFPKHKERLNKKMSELVVSKNYTVGHKAQSTLC